MENKVDYMRPVQFIENNWFKFVAFCKDEEEAEQVLADLRSPGGLR